MSKTAIVYWSGTGNTEALANKIYESAKSLGKDVQIFTAGEFSEDKVDELRIALNNKCELTDEDLTRKIMIDYLYESK